MKVIKALFQVQGFIMVAITLGYIALVFLCCFQWSDQSGAVITGFVLFAQSTVSKFFSWLNGAGSDTVESKPNPTPNETT